MFEAAPVAPPADALLGTAAGPASGDGFEEFWNAWPRKHAIKKARAEWAKIIFDADIVIDAARDWAAHYAKHGTEKKWIPEPANWLAGERWREDLPLIHGDAKGAAIAKAKANAPLKEERVVSVAVNDNQPESGSPTAWPTGWHVGEFTCGDVVEVGTEVHVDIRFLAGPGPHVGREFKHHFLVKSANKAKEEEGLRYLDALSDAVGLTSRIQDIEELLFKPLRIFADGKHLQYRASMEEAA